MKTPTLSPGIWQSPAGKLRRVTNLAMNAKDGSILARIPAGEFEMGDDLGGWWQRKHRVVLSEYWIGVYCVSNRQYGRFVAATKHRVPDTAFYREAVWKNGQCPAEKLDHPVTDVSWDDAQAYAKWADLNLPTEAQWEKAARGPGGLIYPWGDEWDDNKCRNSTNKCNATTAAVWEYPKGTSGYGAMQQVGNVKELCADWYHERYYDISPAEDPSGPQTGSWRIGRGGDWAKADIKTYFRGANRDGSDPAERCGFVGFRLVRTSP